MPRLQLLFDSPNKLAAFLNLILPLFMISVCYLWAQKDKLQRMLAVMLMLLVLLGEFLLVKTYSRGGYIAFSVGLVSLFIFGCRRCAFLFGGLFMLMIAVVPKASIRAVSFSMTQDLSILNRLVLWKSVCEICVDNPLSGVWRSVGEVFTAWYQPMERTQVYLTAVNDYLTIGAQYGLPVLMLWLSVIFVVVIGLARMARHKKTRLGTAVVVGLVSYSIAAVFSTFYTTLLLSVSFVFLLIVGGVVLMLNGDIKNGRVLLHSIVLSVMICLVICVIGFWGRPNGRIIYEYKEIDGIDYVVTKTEHNPIKEGVVYLFDHTEQTLESEGRRTVRHLLKPGRAVVAIGISPDVAGYKTARKLIGRISCDLGEIDRISLVGQNCGGRFVFMLGQELPNVKRVVTIGAYASWPIMELSPSDQGTSQNHPEVWIVNGGSDWRTDVAQSANLKLICESRRISCHVHIVPNAGNDLGELRGSVLNNISIWIGQ